MRRAVLGSLLLFGGACNAVLGIEEPIDRAPDAAAGGGKGGTTSGGSGGSGGNGGTGLAGSGGGGESDGSTEDVAAEADPCGGCSPPTICQNALCCIPAMPVTTSPVIPGGSCGIVCSANEAANQNDQGAGIDCSGTGFGTFDGQNVTACVQADFGTIYNPTDVVVRARVVSKACAVGCYTSTSGTDGCTTGGKFGVFSGASPTAYTFVGLFAIDTSWSDQVASLGVPKRYVTVCRMGYGDYVRDIQVDVIRSTGCP